VARDRLTTWSGSLASSSRVTTVCRRSWTRKPRIHLFLIGYFILIVGVGLALWQAGILQPCRADLAGHWRDRRGRPGNHAVGVVGEADGHRGVEEMTTLTLPAPIVLIVAFICGAVGKALAGGAGYTG
jgi:hypothetical protein